jgi:ring-1,2-phenylacetyl-CoA epoxidase subunit PaaC
MSELTLPQREALVGYIIAVADDELLLGHRASEWTGLGPVLEADIALSSIAQDEMGHAQLFYSLLTPLTGQSPDKQVFERQWQAFRNAQFSELPRGDWGFTLIRHYLHDVAEQQRYAALTSSSYAPLAQVARKLLQEEKYHLIHGHAWIRKLAQATEESQRRMQAGLERAYPYALGLWEAVPGEEVLLSAGIVPDVGVLRANWAREVAQFFGEVGLRVPGDAKSVLGGRQGQHTEYLETLVEALQLVAKIAPTETW